MRVELGERRLRQILTENAIDSGLDSAAIESIVEHAQLAHYDPDETITRPGGSSGLSVIVMSGIVRMMFQGAREDPILVRFIRAGDSLISIDEEGFRPAFSSVAHTHCGVAVVPHEVIADAVARMPEDHRRRFNRHSWSLLSGLVRDRCELLTRNVRQRVLHELSMLARPFGTKHTHGTLIDLPLKQEHLAQLVVVDRSTLNRALRELESDGLLRRYRGQYIVPRS